MTGLNNALDVSRIAYRQYKGERDFLQMQAVIVSSLDADGVEHSGITLEMLAHQYAHMSDSDPFQDTLLAEDDGELVGYGQCFCWQRESGGEKIRVYDFVAYVSPLWRQRGLGEAMLRWLEARLRAIAAMHSDDCPKFFESSATDDQVYWTALLKAASYLPVRYFHKMICADLENVPDFPLLERLVVRPAMPEQYRAIWDSDVEAFRDHWGFVMPTEQDYLYWLSDPIFFQPELWQVAWDRETGEVAGQVQAIIDPVWNEKYGRREGFVGPVSVNRKWRRQGVARALLTRSLQLQKEKGMAQCKLSVDSENFSGATSLYESCGFKVDKLDVVYRKPLVEKNL